MPAEVAGRLLARARIHLFPRSRTGVAEGPKAELARRSQPHPMRQLLEGLGHDREWLLHPVLRDHHGRGHDKRAASMAGELRPW